nr:putative ribonuclease H-like domain-containing protein [Tanacetum cinerariifolium]
MGHFARECRAPRSQDRERRDNYRQGSKVEEQAPKALMAIDGVGWDWSYMVNDEENHALVADEEAPIEFALMAKTSAESEFKLGLKKGELDRVTYIASQSSGSQIKFKDINQINEDDMEEMDIKWNMALLSMRADRYWKKTGKKITIQGTDVARFDKSKVECFNCHKMENHTLVADEEAPTEFALMAKTSAESEVFDNSLCSKAWLAQVEARLAEHRNQEVKYCEKIRVLELKTESRANCFQTASKDLASLLKSQRLDKNKEGLGYSIVPSPPAQVYSPPKKDLSWTGLPEFVDDIVTDYSRPASTIESSPDDAQNRNPSVTETEASPSTISSKLFIKFVKAIDRKFPTGNTKFSTADIGGCKITGKGTIKTGKLEFEHVYFVKDLKYNLFSVSQICDNKNSVLFTNSECIVLGKNFKLSDDANVLLRTPRKHNMYSIDLNNIVSHKDLTCLVTKASADECVKWHRRL